MNIDLSSVPGPSDYDETLEEYLIQSFQIAKNYNHAKHYDENDDDEPDDSEDIREAIRRSLHMKYDVL